MREATHRFWTCALSSACIIFALVGSSSVSTDEGSVPSGDSTPVGTSTGAGIFNFYPSKLCYAPGDMVVGVFRVSGNETVGGIGETYHEWVFDSTRNLIFHSKPYYNYSTQIRPWESDFYFWNQKDSKGSQMQEGNYTLRIGWDPGWLGEPSRVANVTGELTVSIGACEPPGLSVSAGPDFTVREGEDFTFNGSAAYRPPLTCQDKHFARNVKVTDESVRATVGTDNRLDDVQIDANGTVHVVWSDFRHGHHDIFYSQSVDGGRTFSRNVQVNSLETGGHQWKPSMAIDARGTIHVAWEDWLPPGPTPTGIYYSESRNGGVAFGAQVRVANGSDPSIVVDSMNRVHVIFDGAFGGARGVLHTASNENGSRFSLPTQVNDIPSGANGASMGKVAIDPSDTLYVVWSQLAEIYFAKSTDGGESFTSSVKVSDAGPTGMFYYGPEIALDSHGNPHVVWQDNRRRFNTVSEVYYANSSNGGASFNPNIAVHARLAWRQDDGYQLDWAIAIDRADRVHVVWIEPTMVLPANIDVYYATKEEGDSSFSFVERANDNCEVTYRTDADVAVSPDGMAYVVWRDRRKPGGEDVYFSKRGAFDGETGEPELHWDFDSRVDEDGDDNFTNDVDASGPRPVHRYGDNGNFTATLTALTASGERKVDAVTVTVVNVPPSATVEANCSEAEPVDISLRVAGEKWHDVSLAVSENGVGIFSESIVRFPGSPDEQAIVLRNLSMNVSRVYDVTVAYTPEDDPVNGQPWGATPAWIIVEARGQEIDRLHHTFNARDNGTWEWHPKLSSPSSERRCTFVAEFYDPGSDDLHVRWDWGDGNSTEYTYYNDGVGPDPFPSPGGISPFVVHESRDHSYPTLATYRLTLTVTDDDGGLSEVSIVIA